MKELGNIIKDTLDGIADGILFLDTDYKIVFANRAVLELFGQDGHDITGRGCHELFQISPKKASPFSCPCSDVFETGKSSSVTYTHIYPDGTEKVFDITASPIRNERGDIIQVVEILRDVTEKKRVENALKESESKLYSVFDKMQDVFYRTDLDGRVLWVSLSAAKTLGYDSTDELIGLDLAKDLYVSPEKRQVFLEKLSKEGEVTDYEIELYRKDGSTIIVSTNSHHYFDENGNVAGVEEVCRDITKRRQVEDALKTALTRVEEEKARSEAMLAGIGDALGIIDTDYKIVYQNQVSKDMFGDHVGELCFKAYQHRDEVCEGCPVHEAFMDGKVHRVERTKTRGNEIKYFDITVSPLKDLSGKIIAGIEVVRDITERKLMENNIYRYGERLRVLCEIDHAILATQSMEKIARIALDRIVDLMPVMRVSLALFDFNADRVKVFAVRARGKTRVGAGKQFPIDEFGIAEELLKGKIHVCEDVAKVSELPPVIEKLKAEGLRSYINIPLFSLDELIGSLNMGKNTAGEFASEDVSIASEIADLLAVAIQQVRNQEELKISEAKYRDLYDNAPDMYHSLDKDGIIIDCNRTWTKMLAYKKGEIIGRHLTDFFTEESRGLFQKVIPRLTREKVLLNVEREFIRKDGTVFPAILNIFAELDENGALIRTRAIARDISEYKRVESNLKRSIKHLEILHRIDSALLSARPMKETIQRTLEAIRQLLPCSQASVVFYDLNARQKEVFAVNSDSEIRIKEGMQFPLEDDETVMSLNCGEVCLVNRIPAQLKLAEFDKLLKADGIRSYINVPLLDLDELLGTLDLGSDKPRAFSSDDIKVARDLAEKLAVVIQSVKRGKALRESEKKYRSIVDNALVGIYKTSLKGDILYANAILSKMLEFESPQEMMQGGVLPRYKNPDDRKTLIKNLRENGRVDSFEVKLLTKTGKTRDVFLSAKLEDKFISGMVMDVTGQRRAEDAIKESEMFLASILEGIKDGVVVLDGDLKILFANRTYIEQIGVSSNAVRGKHCYEVSYNRDEPCYVDGMECAVDDVFKTGSPNREIRKKSGRYIEMTVYPLKDFSGKVISVVEMRRDVTKHVQLNEELKKRMRELEEFYEMAVGRELKMKQLKEEIMELKEKLKDTKRRN